MQGKGFIKLLAVLLVLACVYQLSFSCKAKRVEKQAAEYAAAAADPAEAERYYLDSVQNETVYNLGFISFTYKQVKEKEINLGLDLKGGMNVMLEVQVEDVIKSLAEDNAADPAFGQALARANEQMRAGSTSYIGDFARAYKELSGGAPLAPLFVSPDRSAITLASTDGEVERFLRNETESAIDASFNILRSRIDHFGVTQPNIQRLPNSHRILVELPGVKEPERVRKLLQGTASLEFWTTYNAEELQQSLYAADQALRGMELEENAETIEAAAATSMDVDQPQPHTQVGDSDGGLVAEVAAADAADAAASETDSLETPQPAAFSRTDNPLFARLNPQMGGGAIVGAVALNDTATINKYFRMPEVRQALPADVMFKWDIKADAKNANRFYLYALKVSTPDGKAPLDGGVITDAREAYSERGATASVSMTMNSDGIREWARLTGENVGKSIAIVLDGYVYSAPTVRQKIEGGNSEISGDFTIQEAKDLANVLKSGKVPAPARIIQDTVVGPSLGQESINSGLLSFVIAFCLVLLYMGIYYKTAGWLADVALLFNVFLLMGVLVSFGAVLTLPGIAGIVLTMGMAVDANVIIYERIKEELRAGKGLGAAVKEGFSKAYSAIIDGNLTTIITGIILFVFGNGPVQGFATTLIIGILTSFFSAVFVTRLLIDGIVRRRGKLSFSRKWSEQMMTRARFDFIGKAKWAYIVMAAFIVIAGVSFATRGLNMGAEFTGGRAYVVRFDKPVDAEQVRERLDAEFAGKGDAANVSFEVKQYGGEDQMRIVTQYKYNDTSDTATDEVDHILYDALKPMYSYDLSFDNFRNTQNDVNGILTADMVGPSIAKDMTWSAIWAVLFSLVAIGLYIALRFRKWSMSLGATAALAVNAFFVIGVYSLLYGVLPFNLEINQAFIAAILTIIGYSINDTVVVFDRIREYLGLYPKRALRENVNAALNSTLSRTINTSGTTLVTLLAILIFGGETIRGFIFALVLGVVVGTLCTLFIATPMAYSFMRKNKLR